MKTERISSTASDNYPLSWRDYIFLPLSEKPDIQRKSFTYSARIVRTVRKAKKNAAYHMRRKDRVPRLTLPEYPGEAMARLAPCA
ncbi:hypothetical protein, partial [Pseudomonas aeruginosa]|uniref:hypothetical protein n=1 Tax=Pseudomonas aeruginosa TaxID=287 RepID=UPI001968D5C5